MGRKLYARQADCKLPAGAFCADDLQCAGTVTYTLIQEADAFVITVQRDGARAAACMLCEIEEERAGMLTRFLYENAVEPAHTSAVLHDLCGSKVG